MPLRQGKRRLTALILLLTAMLAAACAPAADSGDAAYEAQTITVKGLPAGDAEISVAALRALTQHDLNASYKRTTGMYEEFFMQGPYLSDVIAALGGDLSAYAGIGVTGSDGYYCLLDAETIAATPELMLAMTIDGQPLLGEDMRPARLAAPGCFGPYWVRMVDTITLYDAIPEKDIRHVWLFDNLVDGLTPYDYEYYGQKDKSYALDQIFTRFDQVLSTSFFTMKSSDGFKKNEAVSMLLSDYYIKVEGEDAPTNLSPQVMLGMNVQHIAWFSTNADAVVFPSELEKYLETRESGEASGLPLSEILFEVGMEQVEGRQFELFGMAGERVTVSGETLYQTLLITTADGYSVQWPADAALPPVANLLRVSVSGDAAEETPQQTGTADEAAAPTETAGVAAVSVPPDPEGAVILTIGGDGVAQESSWTLKQLQSLTDGYRSQTFSTTNNWPSFGSISANGVSIPYLLEQAGILDSAASIKFLAADGYYALLTYEQVFGVRYSYREHSAAGSSGAQAVEPVIAWEWGEDGAPRAENLRTVFGQCGPYDVNTAVAVKNLAAIEVSAASRGAWEAPTADIASNSPVRAGTAVSLQHPQMDSVRVYYTLDGSEPDYGSAVYNPSASYYQPQLTVPLVLEHSLTVKAFAAGFGKADSPVATFTYTVE